MIVTKTVKFSILEHSKVSDYRRRGVTGVTTALETAEVHDCTNRYNSQASKLDKRGATFCTREIAKCDQNGGSSAHAGLGASELVLEIRTTLGVHSALTGDFFASGPDIAWLVFRWRYLARKHISRWLARVGRPAPGLSRAA